MNFPIKLLFPTAKESYVSQSDANFSSPLYIRVPYVSMLISIVLGRERLRWTPEGLNLNKKKEKSVLILCGYTKETFLKEILHVQDIRYFSDDNSETSIWSDDFFWAMDATGAWISASEYIDLIYVPSLRGLRAILSVYHYSSLNRLAIWPFLKIHEASGEFSAQGLSRTIALAIDVCRNENIILCDSISIKSPIQLLTSSTKVSGISVCSAIRQITVETVMERWISAFWEIVSLNEQGIGHGIWKYRGEYWKVCWKDSGNGKISDIECTQLD
ncbi:hypothetical protein T552_02649 [Pneumocystis carinii B80]|uniref:Uncharacterized protein n=1 Tax=Pneumocystis carinii (strain B80) TaxID=1408658 RepID=A0A0W4ZE38_PNEC8|nr:hypothetical protein T552_02649 [Pneumocystis carinii B80]KTW26640.1 hypothetical protein T552_02649 [Pneumocystis carinii B80]